MVAIQQSAVARGTGIETDYKDLSGGNAKFLPQRIALLAQGQSGVSYSTTKFTVTGGAKQVGSTAGYVSPAYAAARELYPVNGGGVGSIPVDVFLLGEGGSFAVGDITPSASAVSKTSSFVPVIGGVRHNPFTVAKNASFGATDLSDLLEAMRQAIEAKASSGSLVTVAHEYGTVADTADGGNTGDGTISGLGVASGGAPKAGTWSLECTAAATDAGTFKLVDPDGFTVKSTITAAVAETDAGGLAFTIGDGTADWAVGDSFTIEVPSTKLNVTSGWKGSSANDITISIDGPTDVGLSWAFTQPTGGATNPAVDAAVAQIGDVRNTLIINPFEVADTTALDALQSFIGNAEDETGRWAPDVRKPLVAVCGSNAATVDAATTITSTRPTDNGNVMIPVPGSPNIPVVIAAAAANQIAKRANDNPPHDYGSLKLTSITAGADAQQWNFAQRDAAIKRGASTTELKDGVVVLSDVVTMYAPEGEEPPAYRFVVDIMRCMNVLYNVDLKFSGESWDGKPLIPTGQPTVNPEAKTPAMAIADMYQIIDGLALAAIISDPVAAKASVTAVINSQNPKRLDIAFTAMNSGNTNQKAISYSWGFYFG